MRQIHVIFERLKKPSVLISIASQIATILVLFNIHVDMDIVSTVITGLFSILVLLGIISDPTTQTKRYGDDLLECSNCHKLIRHVMVNGKMLCTECGCENCMVQPKA
ncbi:MAG: hypothetical protein GX663_01955 [Clostridiales bacterium]|nr:hypothetical protein [Clostridiales bacterium]